MASQARQGTGGASSGQFHPGSLLEPCEYICGGCGKIVLLKPSDAVRCKHCTYRILYKQRIKKELQYEAR